LQGILALVIVVYTAVNLSNVSVDYNSGFEVYEASCLLGNPPANLTVDLPGDYSIDFNISTSNCLMLEILGGCTIGLGIVLGLLQCYTCHFCGLGGLVDGLFAVAGVVTWVVASILVGQARSDLNAIPPPLNDGFNSRRDVIYYMCWVEVGFFGVCCICSLLKCCCCCCGGGGYRDGKDVLV